MNCSFYHHGKQLVRLEAIAFATLIRELGHFLLPWIAAKRILQRLLNQPPPPRHSLPQSPNATYPGPHKLATYPLPLDRAELGLCTAPMAPWGSRLSPRKSLIGFRCLTSPGSWP
jgi:hypothetical protein